MIGLMKCRFNTQPPEGGWIVKTEFKKRGLVSTRSRPKAAGAVLIQPDIIMTVSTRSRPKAAGKSMRSGQRFIALFQHAAARRRLALVTNYPSFDMTVSTRSRPKAAGVIGLPGVCGVFSFNTQPPEGGW